MIQEPSARYTMSYDKENRLKTYVRPDGLVATYLYDGDGMKRTEQVYNGISTIVWDGSDYLQTRYDSSAVLVSASVPATMQVGHSYVCTFTYQNNGRIAWTTERGFLANIIAAGWSYSGFNLNPEEVVVPNASRTFALTVIPGSAGTVNLTYYMDEVGIAAISPFYSATVTVTP